jgi:hypothetical protein
LNLAADVTALNESTESSLIAIDGLLPVDASQWIGDGSSFNIEFTNGVEIYVVRIDNNTDLATYESIPLSGGNYTIVGIGSQFDTEFPYSNGYQIMPRYSNDIGISLPIVQMTYDKIKIYPNPASGNLNIKSGESIESIEIINQLGEVVNTVSIHALERTIDISKLPAGFYTLKIKTASGVHSSNFIKE